MAGTAAKGRRQQADEAPARHYMTTSELRVAAQAVRDEQNYDGELTPKLLVALEPLLNEPIDPRYIKTIKAQKGKPYDSTGIRTMQVQVDRLNAVLGLPHWRKLLHYEDGGQVCLGHLLIGNNLGGATLDERGQLVEGDAEVLAHRVGGGGHSRGSNRGDLYKGSETNSMKRTIAQAGPGHEVYTLDFDEDVNPSERDYRAPQETAGEEPQAAPKDATAELGEVLAAKDDLAGLREQVDKGMRAYGLSVEDRLARLKSNTTSDALEELQNRISMAIDERDSGS